MILGVRWPITIEGWPALTWGRISRPSQTTITRYGWTLSINTAFINRGVVYAALGNPEQALLNSEEAIRLNSSHAGAYALRAIAYSLLGKEKEAQEDLVRAVELGISLTSLETTIEGLNK